MSADTFWSRSGSGRPTEADGRPEGVSPSPAASREQPPGQGGEVVRVSAADVLAPASFQPPTAQTFEELEIPPSYRAAVEKELTPDEKMLWVGRPSRNPEVHASDPIRQWIGGGLPTLAVVVGGTMIGLGGGSLFGFLFAGVLGVIGLAFLLPLLVSPAKTCRYCYVVTNRRAILVETAIGQRGPVARSYLPQQLLGMERRDHATVAGAGDLIFGYELVIPGSSINPLTGSLLQQSSSGGLSTSPRRVPRGFMQLDRVREVEELIRTTLLLPLEHVLDAPKPVPADGGAPEEPAPTITVGCACGTTLAAPPTLAGKWVKCPRCLAAVPLASREAQAGEGPAVTPAPSRKIGEVPADLEARALAGLDPNEKVVWVGQPVPGLVLLRNGGYFAAAGVGILAALIWLFAVLTPAESATPRARPGKKLAALAAQRKGSLLPPLVLLVASAGCAAVPLVRWWTATRTCYALTSRRALVYREGLFGPTRESYSPLEVSNMRRSSSALASGSGDLIFRTARVISRSQTGTGTSNTSVKTIHYGFLGIASLDRVERLVRETLIDRFVDRLNQASAL